MACGGETASGGTLKSVHEGLSGRKAVFKPQASVRLSALGSLSLLSLSQGPSGGAGWRAWTDGL